MAFLYVFTKPIETIHDDFLRVKKEWEYRLSHNGQVFSIEKVLNDKYDSDQRRIYISDAIYQDDVYVGNRDNRDQIYLTNDKTTICIGAAPQYLQQSDFIVHVPAAILMMNEFGIRGAVDTYKIAGKIYSLRAI